MRPAHSSRVERRFLAPAHSSRFTLSRLVYGGGRGAGTARRLLAPFGSLWAGAAALRSSAAHAGRVRLDRPVLSVGNLGLGGSGKTPFVEWIGRRLAEAGWTTAVLSRGYGWLGRSDPPRVVPPRLTRARGDRYPDEALLLARAGIPVGAHPRRARAAAALARAGFRPDVYLLDDGFQHRQLERDWDLVLLAGRELSAGRRALPAGPFREGWSALGRAQRIAITGLDYSDSEALSRLTNRELGLPPGDPPVLAGLVWSGLVELEEWRAAPAFDGRSPSPGALDVSRGASSWLAFSGIADPASFERLLAAGGLVPAAHVLFPDHHRYAAADLEGLFSLVPLGGALVTTAKDAARLGQGSFPPGACWIALAELRLWRGETSILTDLGRLMAGAPGATSSVERRRTGSV